MHGGVIYIRGPVEKHHLGREVGVQTLNAEDDGFLQTQVNRFARLYNLDENIIMSGDFTKLVPVSRRPYGRLYAY
jgi:glutamate synthase domain-containing protein 3